MNITPVKNIQNNNGISFKSADKKHCSLIDFFKRNKDNSQLSPTYGKSQILLDGLKQLKSETAEFPQDIEYRKKLLKNAGMNPEDYYKIRSIIGTGELKTIMAEFNSDENNYSVGKKDTNIKKGLIRANLHIHTLTSDGFLSTQELLDNAAEYSNKVAIKNPNAKKEPFTIAITDHDTTESNQEAIKIISNDPLKYKNLRVVLGIEMTTFNKVATDIVDYPTNTHVLAYGIDPNELGFKNFIDTTKNNKFDIEKNLTSDANKVYKEFYGKDDFFSIDEAKNFYSPLKKGIIGIYNHLIKYIETKFVVDNIVLKNPKIKESLINNKIPTELDDFMIAIKDFYYPIDKNNKARLPEESVPEFLSAYTNLSKEEIISIIQDGMNLPENRDFKESMMKNLERYKVTLSPKPNYMPNFEDLYAGLKNQNQAIIGIAHPLDTVKKITETEDKYNFLTELYQKFADACKEKACFSEFYYQSYGKTSKALNELPFTKKLLEMLSSTYNLFKTGSADTHRTNIFKRYF